MWLLENLIVEMKMTILGFFFFVKLKTPLIVIFQSIANITTWN